MTQALVGNVHLVAGTAETTSAVFKVLQDAGIATEGNPDVYVRAYEQFGVEEARELRERAALHSVGKGPRVFILSAPKLTSEAQNAFLKTLEEPSGEALFFIITPAPQTLLATLRSRAQTLLLGQKEAESIVDTKAFLAATPEKRLDLLKPLLEKGDDDKRDIGAILTFLSSLERRLGKKPEQDGLRALYTARKYIADKGALVKPLLEHVALLVPRM